MLDVLGRHGARATFFIISDHVAGNEELLRRMVREGHELGNHLTNQEPSISLPGEEFERRLVESHRILSSFGPLRWFRPGSAWYDEEMLTILDRHHYRCVIGRIYPLDGEIDSPDFSSHFIRWMAGSGSIVLLHDAEGRGERSARILDMALPALAKSGYRFLTLSELAETATQE
jgi:peptidoglycan/xylan/chitin deacetylase (PgdA/CDA1 family)